MARICQLKLCLVAIDSKLPQKKGTFNQISSDLTILFEIFVLATH